MWVPHSGGRGECRFGEECTRAKRVGEIVGTRAESVAPIDLGDDMCTGAGGKATDAAVAARVGSSNSREAEWKTAGKGAERDVEAADWRPFAFGRKKIGVARRPSAMANSGGAGAFDALASAEEGVVVEEDMRRRRTSPFFFLSQRRT